MASAARPAPSSLKGLEFALLRMVRGKQPIKADAKIPELRKAGTSAIVVRK